MADFNPLWNWCNERHAIFLRKTLLEGKTPPAAYDPLRATLNPLRWSLEHLTDDPVLGAYRFCNVFRELDRVTIWIRENIREPYADHPHLWLMLAVARTINWPPTLSHLIRTGAWPDRLGFRPETMTEVLLAWQARGEKLHTGAYMIRAESRPDVEWYSWSKARYLAEIVLGRLWEAREFWDRHLSMEGQTLEYSVEQLSRFCGWGPFMSGQTVLEWKHTRHLEHSRDAHTWMVAGPGTRRGLNRLFGRPLNHNLSQEKAVEELRYLMGLSSQYLKRHVPPLDIEDMSNALCETDKWMRVRGGEGRPRAKYVVGRGW